MVVWIEERTDTSAFDLWYPPANQKSRHRKKYLSGRWLSDSDLYPCCWKQRYRLKQPDFVVDTLGPALLMLGWLRKGHNWSRIEATFSALNSKNKKHILTHQWKSPHQQWGRLWCEKAIYIFTEYCVLVGCGGTHKKLAPSISRNAWDRLWFSTYTLSGMESVSVIASRPEWFVPELSRGMVCRR